MATKDKCDAARARRTGVQPGCEPTSVLGGCRIHSRIFVVGNIRCCWFAKLTPQCNARMMFLRVLGVLFVETLCTVPYRSKIAVVGAADKRIYVKRIYVVCVI